MRSWQRMDLSVCPGESDVGDALLTRAPPGHGKHRLGQVDAHRRSTGTGIACGAERRRPASAADIERRFPAADPGGREQRIGYRRHDLVAAFGIPRPAVTCVAVPPLVLLDVRDPCHQGYSPVSPSIDSLIRS